MNGALIDMCTEFEYHLTKEKITFNSYDEIHTVNFMLFFKLINFKLIRGYISDVISVTQNYSEYSQKK
jgi:hypothetical protein